MFRGFDSITSQTNKSLLENSHFCENAELFEMTNFF